MGAQESSVVYVNSPFWLEYTQLQSIMQDFLDKQMDDLDQRLYFDAIETKIKNIPAIKSCTISSKKKLLWKAGKNAIIDIHEFRDGYSIIKGLSSGGDEVAYIGIRNKKGPNVHSLKASLDKDQSVGVTFQTSIPLLTLHRFLDYYQFPILDLNLRACWWDHEKRPGASLGLKYLSTRPFIPNNIKFTIKSPCMDNWMGIISSEISRPILIPALGVLNTKATPSLVFSQNKPLFLTSFDSELTKVLNTYFVYRMGVETAIATGPIPIEFLHEPKKIIHMPFENKSKCQTSVYHQLVCTIPIKPIKGLGIHALVESGAVSIPKPGVHEIKPWLIAGVGINFNIKSARAEVNAMMPIITPNKFKTFQFGVYFD